MRKAFKFFIFVLFFDEGPSDQPTEAVLRLVKH